MSEHAPKSVGLGGDGDEIEAIEDVERAFGVKLDYADAPNWVTAGDVFASLQKALPTEDRNKPGDWKRFTAALCETTGVNPEEIEPESSLLSNSRFWARFGDAMGVFFAAAFLLLAAVFVMDALGLD